MGCIDYINLPENNKSSGFIINFQRLIRHSITWILSAGRFHYSAWCGVLTGEILAARPVGRFGVGLAVPGLATRRRGTIRPNASVGRYRVCSPKGCARSGPPVCPDRRPLRRAPPAGAATRFEITCTLPARGAFVPLKATDERSVRKGLHPRTGTGGHSLAHGLTPLAKNISADIVFIIIPILEDPSCDTTRAADTATATGTDVGTASVPGPCRAVSSSAASCRSRCCRCSPTGRVTATSL